MASISFPAWSCGVCGKLGVCNVVLRRWDLHQTLYAVLCEEHRDAAIETSALSAAETTFHEALGEDSLF